MQNMRIVMQPESGLYNIIENGKVKAVSISGDLLGRAIEMYIGLRDIIAVARGLAVDGVEVPLSLYAEVKRMEPVVAEIEKRCAPSERGTV